MSHGSHDDEPEDAAYRPALHSAQCVWVTESAFVNLPAAQVVHNVLHGVRAISESESTTGGFRCNQDSAWHLEGSLWRPGTQAKHSDCPPTFTNLPLAHMVHWVWVTEPGLVNLPAAQVVHNVLQGTEM